MIVKKEIILIIGASVLTIGIGYILYKNWRNKNNDINNIDDIIDTTQNNIKDNSVNIKPTFPLVKGSRGSEVKKLQSFLNTEADKINLMNSISSSPIEIPQIDIDGIFGDKTLNSCKSVLNRNSISKDYYDKYIDK